MNLPINPVTGLVNTCNLIKEKIYSGIEHHARTKAEKEEFEELAEKFTEELKNINDKMALIEIAKRLEERAKKIRKIAEEL
jgi:septin family protein